MANVLHWSQDQLQAYRKRLAHPTPKTTQDAQTPTLPPSAGEEVEYTANAKMLPVAGWQGKQTETEKRYNREVLNGYGRFEAVTLHLPGGSRYTPDFMTCDEGKVTFHEVKGSYRLGSEGRAKTAFLEACAAFPCWRFVWAKWTGKEWVRKTFNTMV